MQFLDFVQDTCPWFPEEGTVNLETWNKVGDGLRVQCTAEGLECMSIFSFGLWSMIKDCLGPTPSHKERFSSSVFKLGCGLSPHNQASRSVSIREGTKCYRRQSH
jgi:hypothetical protein